MQHHSAEHIVSGLATGLFNCKNVGFHLSDKEVTALGIDTDAPQTAKLEIKFKVGDRVRISSGMMNGMIGEVKNIDMEEMKVDIYISNFPGVSNVTLGINDVALAD